MEKTRPNELSREKLADGNVLLSVKERFQDDMNEDNLVDLMQVLRDSVLILPMQIHMSAADRERMRMYDENMPLVVENDVTVVPATADIEGRTYLFIFSQPEQIPTDYSELVTLMRAPWLKVYEYFIADESLGGIVLDPFTENLELTRELVGAISQMASRLPDE